MSRLCFVYKINLTKLDKTLSVRQDSCVHMATPSPDGIRIQIWQAVFLYLDDVAVIGAIAGLCQNGVSGL